MSRILQVTFIIVACGLAPAQASTLATSDFNALPGGQFGGWNASIDSGLPPLTIGAVTFSFTPSGPTGGHQVGSAFPFTPGGGSDPAGAFVFGPPLSGPPATIIDFSQPVAAFGVSFYIEPGLVEIFNGPGATGALLGSVIGSPPAAPWSAANRPVDFVAMISNQREMRSARITGFANAAEYEVAGIGYTLVPEPATWVLALIGALMLAAVRRRSARRSESRACRCDVRSASGDLNGTAELLQRLLE